MGKGAGGPSNDRARAIEERLDVPVLGAALVSVPAVFLTMASGAAAVVGNVLNVASGTVLVGESLVLLLLSRERMGWIREHRSKLALAAATVPAVILVVGPVQVFRLLIFVSAIRVLRVRRLISAADAVRRRADLPDRHRRLVPWAVGGVAAVFVAVVLADPKSTSHRVVEWTVEHVGLVPVIAAGLLVLVAVVLSRRYRPRNLRRRVEKQDCH